ncbi:MAG: Na+/H+ antiporter subunit B [Planctomycetota bacterium]
MEQTNQQGEGRGAGGASWLFLLPLAVFVAILFRLPEAKETSILSWDWVPSLGVTFSLRLDGLSLLFGTLIRGIGTLIFTYAPGYMGQHRDRWRLYSWLAVFMFAMLGVVFSENLLLLFVFWELTSVSSYMLIGFKHESAEARASALQALLVTGLGALALVAGILMLGQIVGSYEISSVLSHSEALRTHPLSNTCLLLILLGAVTKSAQFPFHFWLPSAMVAPTPVSAYLHSATMVKAGVFLVARLLPACSGLPIWDHTLIVIGGVTAVVAALIAVTETDLKRILAFSTVSSLGLMMMLLGEGSPLAVKAALVLIVCHSFYKAALFMVAGTIDKRCGTRDIRRLSQLSRTMPWLGLAASFGANVAFVAIAGLVAVRPFYGSAPRHTAPSAVSAVSPAIGIRLVLPSLILGGLGLMPTLLAKPLFAPAYAAVLPAAEPLKLKLWHGINLPLGMSILTVVCGVVLALAVRPRRILHWRFLRASKWSPGAIYRYGLTGLQSFAAWQTRIVQPQRLTAGVFIVLVVFAGLVISDFVDHIQVPPIGTLIDLRIYELFIPALIFVAIGLIITTQSRIAAVCGLGVLGYAIAMLFVMYGAPDLAMTQFAIETLTVVLFVFVLTRLPRFARFSTRRARRRHLLLAIVGGGVMAAVTWAATAAHVPSRLSGYFAENSLPLAKGRNLVNVILVDFRGLDTLGETVVLSVAAIGVFALIRIGRAAEPGPSTEAAGDRVRPALARGGDADDSRGDESAKEVPFRLLAAATTYMLPLLFLFAVFLLLRGHNDPGGGFAGGLVAAAAFALFAMTFGVRAARRLQGGSPRVYLATGLSLAVAAGLIGLCAGDPFLTSVWASIRLPAIGKLGTPLLFDIGVCLVVIGMATMIIYELAELPAERS